MADQSLVTKAPGKQQVHEMLRKSRGILGSSKYHNYLDGRPRRGSFTSLRDAVERFRRQG